MSAGRRSHLPKSRSRSFRASRNQAVIAIENSRLFEQVQTQGRELAARNNAFRERIEHQVGYHRRIENNVGVAW